jgi:hypothetical protein
MGEGDFYWGGQCSVGFALTEPASSGRDSLPRDGARLERCSDNLGSTELGRGGADLITLGRSRRSAPVGHARTMCIARTGRV